MYRNMFKISVTSQWPKIVPEGPRAPSNPASYWIHFYMEVKYMAKGFIMQKKKYFLM